MRTELIVTTYQNPRSLGLCLESVAAQTVPSPVAVQRAMDRLTPVQKALCGANWSAFRSSILKVNGFNEDIQYGGLDKELGVRLENAGIRGQHLRHTAPVVHLDHPRGYKDWDKKRRHKRMIREAAASGTYWTSNGIAKADSAKLT